MFVSLGKTAANAVTGYKLRNAVLLGVQALNQSRNSMLQQSGRTPFITKSSM